MGFLEPSDQLGQCRARFDAKFVRAGERPDRVVPRDLGVKRAEPRGVKPMAAVPHLGVQERLNDIDRLWAADGQEKARLFHRDPCLRRHLGPDVACPPRQRPVLSTRLPGDRDESEISDGCAVCAGIAVNHDHAFPGFCGGQGMAKADDSGPNDSDVKTAITHLVSVIYRRDAFKTKI